MNHKALDKILEELNSISNLLNTRIKNLEILIKKEESFESTNKSWLNPSYNPLFVCDIAVIKDRHDKVLGIS